MVAIRAAHSGGEPNPAEPGSLHLPSELQQKPGSFRRDRSETAGRPLSTTEGQDKTALLVLGFHMKGLCCFPS